MIHPNMRFPHWAQEEGRTQIPTQKVRIPWLSQMQFNAARLFTFMTRRTDRFSRSLLEADPMTAFKVTLEAASTFGGVTSFIATTIKDIRSEPNQYDEYSRIYDSGIAGFSR
jgi:hypothetical protein